MRPIKLKSLQGLKSYNLVRSQKENNKIKIKSNLTKNAILLRVLLSHKAAVLACTGVRTRRASSEN